MYKVMHFICSQVGGLVLDMDRWFEENEDIEIVSVTQSEGSKTSNPKDWEITVIVIYKK